MVVLLFLHEVSIWLLPVNERLSRLIIISVLKIILTEFLFSSL